MPKRKVRKWKIKFEYIDKGGFGTIFHNIKEIKAWIQYSFESNSQRIKNLKVKRIK